MSFLVCFCTRYLCFSSPKKREREKLAFIVPSTFRNEFHYTKYSWTHNKIYSKRMRISEGNKQKDDEDCQDKCVSLFFRSVRRGNEKTKRGKNVGNWKIIVRDAKQINFCFCRGKVHYERYQKKKKKKNFVMSRLRNFIY